MATKIYLRRGTRAELLDIIPEAGEPCWATDTQELYIGDDVTSGGIFIGGTSVNVLVGAITIVGAGSVTVSEDGQVITISGIV